MIPILGIVGGIGSGKSLVAEAMVALGGHLISADQFGHDALRELDIREKLIDRWGGTILDHQGNPDRKKIGRIVFADAVELRALEAVVFRYIEKQILAEIARAQARRDVKFIVLDAAILFETGWSSHCDRIFFVEAPRETRLARLKEKRGWDEAELDRREKMQMPLDEKKARADAVIVNDAGPEKVLPQVQDALVRWKMI
ncbi:MAG: dephospho-CoA kinase [Planctomycetes bacterium]|jgi:dephospho-CoA kinase|nr:dephospho-CoA kinase [Planctomycetota bacterium]